MNPYSGLGDFGPQTIISVTSVGIAKRRLQMNDMNDPNPRVFFGVWEVLLNGIPAFGPPHVSTCVLKATCHVLSR